ncbi:hypothetical protein IIY66_01300 [Candidatus Saccharibacteria bacterium]|nr:hypothetical protein [Candidatus Saccharibacteria bacterium]
MKDILSLYAYSSNGATPETFDDAKNLEESIIGIINAIIGVLGIVAVVVIIIGGISYMTSSGDAGKVKKAKDTILYGVIGLVICVLAFAIVNFVIKNIIGQ